MIMMAMKNTRLNMVKDVLYHLKMEDKYKNFVFYEEGRSFDALFKNKHYDLAQIHRIVPVKNKTDEVVDFLHFKGAFSWNSIYKNYLNNEPSPTNWKIYGSHEFETETEEKGIDILIIEEW